MAECEFKKLSSVELLGSSSIETAQALALCGMIASLRAGAYLGSPLREGNLRSKDQLHWAADCFLSSQSIAQTTRTPSHRLTGCVRSWRMPGHNHAT